ncbi:hypothetical protein IWW51_004764 [Coemansia sp. RSA 2702]|nr:hypothetical protein IWW51_004764 [Coemansia sp. RSA 2702]
MTNVSLGDQLQHVHPLPAYTKGSTVLSFDSPLVSRILMSDTSPVLYETPQPDTTFKQHVKRAPPCSPTVKGIRRIMRRARTPEGLVLHYESRLRSFLGVGDSDLADGLLSDDEDWQVIDMDEGMFSPFGRDMLFDEGDMVVLNDALLYAQQSKSRRTASICAGIESSLVAEWPIQDSFTRLVVHNMCRYYGLVSFSDTLDSGKRVLHICHPCFFKHDEDVNLPKMTFHQYLYNDSK